MNVLLGRARGQVTTVRQAIRLVYSADRIALLVILASTLVTSAAIAGQLLVGRTLLDLIADESNVGAGRLAPYLVVLGVLLVLSALSQAVAADLRVPLGEQVERRAMDDILDVATEVDLEVYDGSDYHNRLERASNAAGTQSSAVVFGLVTMASTLVVSLGVIAVLLTVAPILVPIALLGYAPVAVVNVRNNRAKYEMERDLTELQRERTYLEYVMTDRDHAKELRAYGMAPALRRWHDEFWDARLIKLRAVVRRRLRRTTAATTMATIVLVLTLSLALLLAARGTISLGDAAVAIVGLQQLSGRLQSAGVAFGAVHEGMTFLRDYDGFRATLPTIRAGRPTAPPPSPPTVLQVEGLAYRYPGAPDDALRSVSFEVRRGQTLAVVGANGSGKTTLAKLLCDLLTPSHGCVRWDGVDLAACDPAAVRAQIAPVFQDFTQYAFTIRRAIGIGDLDRLDDDAGIRRAAHLAGLDELISGRPVGVDVRLGPVFADGVDVSVGQWQRMAIARALFRDAPVVVMDEPSASLDPRAETELFDLLQALGAERIVIFVSHRFATVRAADLVLVLDHGAVVELGSHEELMAAAGLYAELFTLQAERYGLGA